MAAESRGCQLALSCWTQVPHQRLHISCVTAAALTVHVCSWVKDFRFLATWPEPRSSARSSASRHARGLQMLLPAQHLHAEASSALAQAAAAASISDAQPSTSAAAAQAGSAAAADASGASAGEELPASERGEHAARQSSQDTEPAEQSADFGTSTSATGTGAAVTSAMPQSDLPPDTAGPAPESPDTTAGFQPVQRRRGRAGPDMPPELPGGSVRAADDTLSSSGPLLQSLAQQPAGAGMPSRARERPQPAGQRAALRAATGEQNQPGRAAELTSSSRQPGGSGQLAGGFVSQPVSAAQVMP